MLVTGEMAVSFVQEVGEKKDLVLAWACQNGLLGVRYSLTQPKYVTTAKAVDIGKLTVLDMGSKLSLLCLLLLLDLSVLSFLQWKLERDAVWRSLGSQLFSGL